MATQTGDVRIHVPEFMKFFERPKFDAARRRGHHVFVDPRAPLDVTSSTEVEFKIPASTSEHIDFKRTYLMVDMSFDKVVDQTNVSFNDGTQAVSETTSMEVDGGDEAKQKEKVLTSAEKANYAEFYRNNDPSYRESYLSNNADFIVPTDAFIHTMWRNVTFMLNGVPVYSTNNDHPYRAYIDTRLRTKDEDMKTARRRQMYTRDQGPGNEPNPWKAKNLGGIARHKRIRRRNKVRLSGIIKCDFMEHANHYLMNGVALDIKLVPAADKFRFQVCPDSLQNLFRFKVEKVQMKVQYVTISPDALQGIESGLTTSPAMYPYPRTECKILPLHKGIREYRLPELFDKQIPVDMVLAMVDRDNFTGTFKLNPFFFRRNQLETAAFYLDNVSIPGEPYYFEPEGSDEDQENLNRRGIDECLLLGLEELHEVAGTTHNGFDEDTWKDGNFLVCFKTDPTVPADMSFWGVPKSGNTSLYLRFHEPLECEQELIILARFPGLLTIDKNRRVVLK